MYNVNKKEEENPELEAEKEPSTNTELWIKDFIYLKG